MKKFKKVVILFVFIFILLLNTVYANGGNISGYNDKNSDKIIRYNGKYYGYHNQNNETHYHQVQWNSTKEKWEIVMPAVYYDKTFNIIQNKNKNTPGTYMKTVTLNSIVDGDTARFVLDNEIVTVRFLGIDTPETKHPKKEIEKFGKEASSFTKELLENADIIKLEFEKEIPAKDKYNRLLAWVWVDYELLQEELISNGLGKTYMLEVNYKYADVLQLAEQQAQENKTGLWSNEEISKIDFSTENTINNTAPSDQPQYENIVGITLIIIVIVSIVAKFYNKKK